MNFSNRFKFLISLILFPLSLTLKSGIVLEDLEENRADWDCFSDRVMGGVSEGKASVVSSEESKFFRLEGNVSTENNGGFIQCRANVNLKTKNINGVRIKIKGNGDEYYVHLRVPRMLPWNYYSSKFYATEEWQVIDLPLSSFEYSRNSSKKFKSSKISTIGIVAYGKDFYAQVDLAQLEVY